MALKGINHMTSGKRLIIAKGKGYFNAIGPQTRFIVFIIFILIAFTLLLRVFQKLAEILQLPLFLPISLVTMFIFIGIVGTVYSHKFLGPIFRIRRAIEMMADGDMSINLRLRESDDPVLKDLVDEISRLCEHNRHNHTLIKETAVDLFNNINTLHEKLQQGPDAAELRALIENVRKKQELLDKAIKSHRKV
jgi:methyl-accepting chemotaxis protein